jgi:hypothetical protein
MAISRSEGVVICNVPVFFTVSFLLGAEFTWVYSHEYGSKAAQTGQKSPSAVPSRSGGIRSR